MEGEPKKFEIHKTPEDNKREIFNKLEEIYSELDHGNVDMDREKRDVLKNKIKEVMSEL